MIVLPFQDYIFSNITARTIEIVSSIVLRETQHIMKIRSLILGLGLGCGVVAPISLVQAQPAIAPVEVKQVRVSLDKEGLLRLSGEFENIQIVAIANAIAGASNLQIIVGDGQSRLKQFAFVDQRPDDAFALLCYAAKLNFIKHEGRWILSEAGVDTTISVLEPKIEFDFRDISVIQLMKMIGENFELKIEVDAAIPDKEKLDLISLKDMNVEQALRHIAAAADLQLTREGETFFVKPQPIAP